MHTLPPAAKAPSTTGMPPPAWLHLDTGGLLVHANPGALALLAGNAEVLQLQCGRLHATRQPERLEQALLLAKMQGRCALALLRTQRLPLTLLCEHRCAADPAPGWHISLRDPETEHPDRHLVQALFGLTPSEAEVATALALGRSTGEIALALGVQANTVLAHVKKVLTKTGTQRQAQLVSLLLRSVAMVGAHPAHAAHSAHSAHPAQPAAQGAGAGVRHTRPPGCGVAATAPHAPCPSR